MLVDSCTFRIAIFTHDAYGIGHVKRCLNIIWALAKKAPQSTILFITGSPAVDLLKYLPPNSDYVKIPTIATSNSYESKPPMLSIGLADLSLLRREIIQEAVLMFEPDILLVDNFPLGARRELLPILKHLRHRSTRLLLGLRDIADPPEKIKKDWSRDGIYEVLERYYDRILVYGMRDVVDIAETYALSDSIIEKIHYCGYLTSNTTEPRPIEAVRQELGIDEPFILATAGGGGDGFPLLKVFLETLPLVSKPSVVITGPRMHISERTLLLNLAEKCSRVKVIEFVPDLSKYIGAAELVISMGGYNTLAEIMAHRCKAIVFPRTWYSGEHTNPDRARVDLEQLTRAKALSKLGIVDMLQPEELKPELLARRIITALNNPLGKPKISVNVKGLDCAVNHIVEMAVEGHQF